MTRLPLKLQRLGFLLGLMVACSDGPHGPGPTTPAPPRIEPASRTVEPAPEVAHSTAPAPPQAAVETGGPEAAEGGEATSQVVESQTAADNPPPPAPSSGSGAPPPDNPGNGSGGEEEEEEEKKEGEGAGEGEEEEPGPRQKVPCDQVGSADISARATSDTTVDLTWSFSTEPECEQFVTFSISRDGTTLTPDSTRSHTDTGRTANTGYRYTVVANTLEGDFQSTASVTTWRSAPTGFDVVLLNPSDPDYSTALRLTWDRASGSPSYKARTKVGSDGIYDPAFDISSTGSHKDGGLTTGTTYCYEIYRSDTTPRSAWTEAECGTPVELPPPSPTGLRVSASGSTITIRWNTVTGATGYKIWRGEGRGTNPTQALDTVSSSPYRDTGLEAGTEFCYAVSTVRGKDESPRTAEECATTAPPAPTRVAAAGRSAGEIRIIWTAAKGATSYMVRRKDTGSTETDNRSPFDWSGLNAGTTYCFDVKATNAAGSSPWSSEGCATPPDKLGTPRNVRASASGSTITVRWSSVTDATGYKVWRRKESGAYGSPYRRPSSSPLTDSGLEAGTRYCYAVSATGSRPESDRSSEECATTAPPAPTGVNADEKSATRIRITWTAAKGATSYTVRIDDDDNDTEIATGTHHDWDDLSPNTRYCFDVKARNAAGSSSWSAEGCDTTDVVPPLPAPENVQASARSSSEIRITWNSVTDATGYTVRRDGDDNDTRTASGTSFDWSGLDPGMSYCFDVKATNSTSSSDWSTDGCAPTTLDPPSGFTSDGATTTSVSLSWTAAAGADGYEVRHKRMDLTNWGSWVATDSATGHTVMVLQAGLWYDFEVWSTKGTVRSSAVSHSARTQAATPGPDRPEDLAAASAAVSSMDLRWTGVAGADSYELQRKVGESGSFAPGTEFDAGSGTSHVDRTVSLGTTYCYRARTVDGGQRSDWTEAVCASPGVPGTFQAAAASPTAVDLSWDSVTGAGSYEVRHRVARGAWENWSDVSSATSHRVSGLLSVTEYEFEVRTAVGTAKSLAASDGAETPEPGDPDPPALFDAQAASDTAINLGWDAVSGADRYEFVRKEGAGGNYPPDANAVDVGDVTQYADNGPVGQHGVLLPGADRGGDPPVRVDLGPVRDHGYGVGCPGEPAGERGLVERARTDLG